MKHFIEARKDPRTPDQIKLTALELVQQVQASATPADRAATEVGYGRLLARAKTLAHAERTSPAQPDA
jgi:hypothetical protein